MSADSIFTLVDRNRVTRCRRDARIFKTGRAGTDHQHPLARIGFRQRMRTPDRFAPDHRVVGALDAAAADDRSPAIVGGNAAPNVFLAALFYFRHPLFVGDHLPG